MIISVVKPFSLYLKWSKKKNKITKLILSVFQPKLDNPGKKELVKYEIKKPSKRVITYLSSDLFNVSMGNLKENESVSSGSCPNCFICTDEEFTTLYGICLTTSFSSKIFIIEETEELKNNDFIDFDTVMSYHSKEHEAELNYYKSLKINFLCHFSEALVPKKIKIEQVNDFSFMLTKCYDKPFIDNTGKVWSSIFKPEEYGFSSKQLEDMQIFEIRKLKNGIRISSEYLLNIL